MKERRRLANQILRALSLAMDTEESIKLHHAWRVAVIARRLGSFLGLSDTSDLFHAGLLHDIGGIGMRDHVVHAARGDFATPESRLHPSRGARIVEPITLLRELAPIILHHHEHYDGTGFPHGMRGTDIPIASQVILLADLLDVNLRDLEPEDRPRAASIIADAQRGKRIHPDVGTAAMELLSADPAFITNTFDIEWLEREVERVNPPLRSLAETTREELLVQLLWVFARVVDAKHSHTAGHSARVAFYAYKIAQAFGGAELDVFDALWSGLLHDVGQVATPRRILEKEGPLSEYEWHIVREHPRHSERIISSISELSHLAYPAACHHERYDGTGYPGRRSGEGIPLLGRILAYADMYDAVTSDRPHRAGGTHEDGLQAIRAAAGHQLDPHLLDVAVEAFERHGVHKPSGAARGFRRLLSDEVVQISDVFEEEAPTSHRVRLTDQRVLLLQAEQWRTAYLDESLRIVHNRDVLESYFGLPLSQSVLEAFEPPDASELERQATNLRPRESFTQYFESRSGEPVEVVVVGRVSGGFTFLCRSAKGKFQSVKRLAMFNRNFAASSEASMFLDAAGTIVDANETFLHQYRTSSASILGSAVLDLPYAWAKPLAGIVTRCIREQATGFEPLQIVDELDNGTEVVALLSVAPVHDASGVFVGAVARFVDITARRRAEQELELRNRELADRNEELRLRNEELERLNRLKSDLMAITSHDLNSPLAAVVSLARLVRDEAHTLPPQGVARAMDRLIDGGLRLRRLVHDILDLERIEAGTFKLHKRMTYLDAVVADVVENIDTSTNGVVVESSTDPDAPPIEVDAARIEQVIGNLLSNALRFSPPGRTVRVEHSTCPGGGAIVSVADRGPGIPQADLVNIFDRYYQVERKHAVPKRGFGAGLGLSIVREIVALHNGTVRAENRPDGGCRFIVELPKGHDHPVGALRAVIVDPRGTSSAAIESALRTRSVEVTVLDDADLARRTVAYERPALLFACAGTRVDPLLVPDRSHNRRQPTIVVVCNDDSPCPCADAVLAEPVLDVEVFEIVEAARMRAGGNAP